MRTNKKMMTVFGGLTYQQRILALSPWAYWPLDDAAGSTSAREVVNGWAFTTLGGVTFGTAGISAGATAATLAGSGVGFQFPFGTAAFANNFPKTEGALLWWMKVATAVWESGATAGVWTFQPESANTIYIEKKSANNQFQFHRRGNSTSVSQIVAESRTTWLCSVQTWSVAANELRGYFNGTQVTLTHDNVYAWPAIALTANSYLGSGYNGTNRLAGQLAHAAIFNRALTPAEILALATA